MKTCSKCKIDKPLDQFNKHSKRKDGLQTLCKKCNSERSRQYYAENREKHIQVTLERKNKQRDKAQEFVYQYKLDHPCECGETRPPALDFHHCKGEKEHLVSKMVNSGYNISSIQKEIEKCGVLCSNCHRCITAEDASFYSHRA